MCVQRVMFIIDSVDSICGDSNYLKTKNLKIQKWLTLSYSGKLYRIVQGLYLDFFWPDSTSRPYM